MLEIGKDVINREVAIIIPATCSHMIWKRSVRNLLNTILDRI